MVDIDPPSQDANLWSPSPFSIDLLARGLLVVADSERQRVVAIDILNSLGFQQIIEAENGGGALALLATHSPAVLIVDLEMPNKDGIELIHQTRICSLEALARWRTNRQTTW